MNIFEKYLTLWVALCMCCGVAISLVFPFVPLFLSRFEYAHVSLPIAILLWFMITPMMLKIDFLSIRKKSPFFKGTILTLVINWLLKPLSMYFFGFLFIKLLFSSFISPTLANEYMAGLILLGAAPCTAMVFVWSKLTGGDPTFTLLQVALNDIILLFAFIPIVQFLLGISGISIPYSTLILSVVIFIVFPLFIAMSTQYIYRHKKVQLQKLIYKVDYFTIPALLLTLVLIFSFQGQVLLDHPLHVILLTIPLIIQTVFIFFLTFILGRKLNLPHSITCPSALIGTSNFFELAVAISITLFGLSSGATLATIVGVLIEVPAMLLLVRFANQFKKTKGII